MGRFVQPATFAACLSACIVRLSGGCIIAFIGRWTGREGVTGINMIGS